jgi:hypothetical protein
VLTERDTSGERVWYNASIAAIKFIPKPEHSIESKKKMSESQRGKSHTKKTKMKMSVTKKKMYDEGLISIPIITKDKWTEDRINRQSELLKEMWKNDPKFGIKKYSEEDRAKLSENMTGEKNPMHGRKHSEKTIQMFSDMRRGVKQSIDHVNKRVLKNKGKRRSDEFKIAHSKRFKGIKQPRQVCEYCNKEMSISNLKKYGHHYGKCIGNEITSVLDKKE